MTVTRLTGGLTPGDGGDPRTFPAIWNDTADAIDSLSIGTAVASDGQVLAFSSAVSGYAPVDVFGGAVNGTAVYRYVDTVYFTSNGTFSKGDYPWLRAIRVKCQGAGGGGNGVNGAEDGAGGGGGGGGYGEGFITDIAGLASSVSVTRGAGGAGAADNSGATSGGSSSFGALVDGGGGNSASTNGQAGSGAGASGTSLDFTRLGGDGQTGALGIGAPGGVGGSSFLGGGGKGGRLMPTTSVLSVGVDGNVYGGGGGGACHLAADILDRAGGNGGDGIVIVELYA